MSAADGSCLSHVRIIRFGYFGYIFDMYICLGITPSFFEATNNTDVVDEFTLGQLVDNDAAQAMLEKHWQTWYTEDDFVQIAKSGLNFVR